MNTTFGITQNYSYSYIMEYLPTRYQANPEQMMARQEVYHFKDGMCSLHVKDLLCEKIREKVGSNGQDWVVLFIPASNAYRTFQRFHSLASYISSQIGVKATLDGIKTNANSIPVHQGGLGRFVNKTDQFTFNTSVFQGKSVILIDDVITSGNSFENCASALIENGAQSVDGLFVAKTINPDWNSNFHSYRIA
jgi:phosphoribosylpyrophosphate synthetase